MKFIIEDNNKIGEQELTYIEEECSFYMDNAVDKADMELIINKISLSVYQDKIVDVSGFCGLAGWMKSDYSVPEYQKGILKVEHNLEYGFAYGINDEDEPVYVNTQTGWVCVGSPEKSGNAVEFINNCVAVISDDGEFLALWLKPQRLPKL